VKRDAAGNVRLIRTEWAEWDLTSETWGPATRATLQEYRLDGQLHASEFSFPNSPLQQSLHLYDDAGRLVETQHRSAGEPAWRSQYSYDTQGRLVHTTGISPDGTEHLAEEYTYEPDGTHARVRRLPSMPGSVGYSFDVEGIDFSISAEGVRTQTTRYAADDLATEVELADAAGEVLRRLVISRHDSGRLVKGEVFFGGKPMVPQVPNFGVDTAFLTQEYSYDEEGRRIELRQQMVGGLSEELSTYSYDDRGNQIATTREDRACEGWVGEDGKVQWQGEPRVDRQENRSTYRYDARGNWVERVISQRHGDNPDFTPGVRELREIIYFD
jgi:YD repeat-containing protein